MISPLFMPLFFGASGCVVGLYRVFTPCARISLYIRTTMAIRGLASIRVRLSGSGVNICVSECEHEGLV